MTNCYPDSIDGSIDLVQILTIDFHILNFTALSVVGVLQYSLLPLAL